MEKEKFYKISEKELRELIYSRVQLEALEAGGVDNWSWYSESFSDYVEDYFGEEASDSYDMTDIIEQEMEHFEEV